MRLIVPVLLVLLFAAAPVGAGAQPGSGSLRLALDACSLEIRLADRVMLGPDVASKGSVLFSFRAEDAGALVKGGLSLGSAAAPSLIAGPGDAAGPLLLIAAPASLSEESMTGFPLRLDGELSSRRSVLGLTRAPLSIFALREGGEAGILLGRPRPEPLLLESTSALEAGMEFKVEGGAGAWLALASAAFRGGSEGSGGWAPASPPDLAGLVFHGALLGEKRGSRGGTSLGIAASFGGKEGAGLAARILSSARRGALSLRCGAGATGPGFRGLFGKRLPPSFSLRGGMGVALPGGGELSLDSSLASAEYSPGPGLRAQRFGTKARLAADLPRRGSKPGRGASIALESPPASPARLVLDLDSSGGTREGRVYARRLGLEAEIAGKGGALEGLALTFAASLEGGERMPSLAFDLALDLLDGTDPEAPVLAEAELALELPLGRGRLRLAAATPEGGLAVGPPLRGGEGAARGGAPPLAGAELSLGYLSPLGR